MIPRPNFLKARGVNSRNLNLVFLQKLCIGGSLDVDMISILTYAIHQASIENLRDLGASPVITDLSSTPRKLSAADMSASISDMFLTEPPYKWQNHSKSIHTPNYFVTIPAVATTAFSVGFDDGVVDSLAPILLNLFGIGQEDQDFLLNEYIPEVPINLSCENIQAATMHSLKFLQLRSLINDLQLRPGEKLHLQGNVISAAAKLLYACVWQEEFFEPPFLFDPRANEIGAKLIPIVNAFANQLNDFTYYDQNFQVCKEVFRVNIKA